MIDERGDTCVANTLVDAKKVSHQLGPYRLETRLGAGAMGDVWGAIDTRSGHRVAIKLSAQNDLPTVQRFAREVGLLASLDHPAIVPYIDRGVTPDGRYFLVMEWLEGEDLSTRLRRGPLSLDEVSLLGRRLCSALSAAHNHQIIHRDLKPANIFLVDDAVEHAMLIDFGIARDSARLTRLTRTGGLLGTPAYMSPEQARGDVLDHRSDLFALGSVLYECISGTPPFNGKHAMAVLAKVLFDEPPALSDAAPLPMRSLLASLLAKEPSERPKSAELVLAALDPTQTAPTLGLEAKPELSGEQRFVSLIMTTKSTGTFAEVAENFGATCQQLLDGRLVVVVDGNGLPSDRARLAARCALALRERDPELALGIASGHGHIQPAGMVGDVIDRAVSCLDTAAPGCIYIDLVSAKLLGPSFEVRNGTELVKWHRRLGPVERTERTVLGRTTPFVGRARELGILTGLLDESLEELQANAVVITAPAGLGKSRFGREFVTRVRSRDEPLEIVLISGDQVGSTTAYDSLSRCLHSQAHLQHGLSSELRHRRFYRMLERFISSEKNGQFLAPFLALIAGVLEDPIPPQILAARADPQSMKKNIQAAWSAWLRVLLQESGGLVVVEDLQWCDEATRQALAFSLSDNVNSPILLLCLCRPRPKAELDSIFPTYQHLELAPLSRRAAHRIAQAVLTEQEKISSLVAQAGGNPLFLEELLRWTVHANDCFDEGLIGLLQTRFEHLSKPVRKVLRTASVFGEVFWPKAVAAVLGETDEVVEDSVAELIADELIQVRQTSTIVGISELRFAHALIRDAAYATLTPEDKTLAHGRAGVWFESFADTNPSVAANHFLAGGRMKEAARWCERAASHARSRNELVDVNAWADRAITCGVDGQRCGRLRLLQAEAARWLGGHEIACVHADEALRLLTPGSTSHFEAYSQLSASLGRLGNFQRLHALVQPLVDESPRDKPAARARLRAQATLGIYLVHDGRFKEAQPLLDQVRAECSGNTIRDTATLSWLEFEFTVVDAQGQVWHALEWAKQLQELAVNLGQKLEEAKSLMLLCHAWTQLGQLDNAVASAAAAGQRSLALGMHHTSFLQQVMQAKIRYFQGEPARALAALAGLEDRHTIADPRVLGAIEGVRAECLLALENIDQARTHACAAEQLLQCARPLHAYGLAILTRAELACGHLKRTMSLAEAGINLYKQMRTLGEEETNLHVAIIQALLATKDSERARKLAHEYIGKLHSRSAEIEDHDSKRTFLENVPANRILLDLAKQLTDS